MGTPEGIAAAEHLRALRLPLVEAVHARLVAAGEAPAPAGDVGDHVDALAAALRGGGADELSERCAWMAVLASALGIAPEPLARTLAALREEIAERLPAGVHGSALAVLDAARERLTRVPLVTPPELAVVPPAAGPPYASAADALEKEASRIASLTVALAYQRRPRDALEHGTRRHRALEDTRLHLGQLVATMRAEETALFGEYVAWAQTLLAAYGLGPAEVDDCFSALADAIGLVLPEALAAAPRRIITEALDGLRGRPMEVPSFIDPAAPLGPLAKAYLDALHAGDRREACRLVLGAAEAGTPVGELYKHVLQPCQYELGRLWQAREISVAEEHYCTAVTQMVMSRLEPLARDPVRVGRLLLATSAPGNLHEVGIRFVADFFEMAGWDTLYLGAGAPAEHVVRELTRQKADALAISATLADQLAAVRALIAAVRAEPGCAGVPILVGGYPFRVVHDLWKRVGADGYAPDAEAAVALAERLVAPA
jgi:methanogenic corrinoid protein MtbC1